MHKYETRICWSESDRCFVAEVPQLAGCLAHGDSPELALANCNEAVSLWLETAQDMGRPVPAPLHPETYGHRGEDS